MSISRNLAGFGSTANISGYIANTSLTGVVVSSQVANNITLTNPTITNYVETAVNLGTFGSTYTFNLANGTQYYGTLNSNCTFTMPTAVAGKSFTVILNTGTGGFTTTSFTSVKWAGGSAPVFTGTANRWDIYSFTSNGTNWFGTFSQAYA
jgi:hypothetical protein